MNPEGTDVTGHMTTMLEHAEPAALPPTSRRVQAPAGDTRTVRGAALVAGAALMLMAGLAGFGNLVVMAAPATSGDAAETAAVVIGSVGLFRLGVASLYLAVLLDVLVAWALMRVFSPVDEALSRLAAWFRLAYAGVFMVAVSQLPGIPALLSTSGYATAFTPEQLRGQALLKVDTFLDVWFAGLILFGIHLALTGYLAYRSGFVPRAIAVLLVVAGAGYVLDSVVRIFIEEPAFAVSNVTFLGELLLALWLLFRGRRFSLVGGRHER